MIFTGSDLDNLHLDDDASKEAASDTQKLFAIAKEIRLWQDSQSPKLSDNAMLKRYPALGSTKTYKKLVHEDITQLKAGEWLRAYEGVLKTIEAEVEARAEIIHDGLSMTDEVYRATLQLVQQRGLNRLLMIEGDSGSGKTQALKHLVRRLPGGVIYVEADETWASPWAAAGDILIALGVYRKKEDLPNGLADRIAQLVTALQKRLCIAIDEGHHMSGRTINMIKTLLNRTQGFFIIAALDTLWKKLTAASWQEAKQLIFNRMFARVRMNAPTVEDVQTFFAARMETEGDVKPAIKSILGVAGQYGRMAFLRNVAERCQRLGVAHVDAHTLIEAANHVKQQVEGK